MMQRIFGLLGAGILGAVVGVVVMKYLEIRKEKKQENEVGSSKTDYKEDEEPLTA